MNTEIVRTEQAATIEQAAAQEAVRHWVVPPVDVLEKEGDLRLRLDVPGVGREGLTLQVFDGILTVTGRRSDHPQRGYRRRFRLPDHVDVDRVSASLKHGLLTVELPRSEAAKPRQIVVQGH